MTPSADPGFHLILRIDEPQLSDATRTILQALRPVGVHFGRDAFLHNEPYAVWLAAFGELRDAIRAATGRERLIWALDHEGGRVHRLPAPIAHFPYPLNWRERAPEVGKAVGVALHSLGMNVVFGPCLDVFAEPQNEVIGPRAFGRDAQEVVRYALPYVRGVQSEGVASVGKHYPGHGRTLLDSHFALPSLDDPLETLRVTDLAPFEAAMGSAELGAIMSAHILFPAIDGQWPASLSNALCGDFLRDTMGFEGVVIADDFDMKAVADRYSLEALAARTLAAPADMVIFNHHYGRAFEWSEAIRNLVAEDEQAAARLAAGRARVVRWLNRLRHPSPSPLEACTLRSHQALADALPQKHTIEVEEFTGE
ncbi:MAG: glycoside hydrolase family 3 N-terminal domain-containing protein [Pseudomonadota bacterium]